LDGTEDACVGRDEGGSGAMATRRDIAGAGCQRAGSI
jgi:hypothetical protein